MFSWTRVQLKQKNTLPPIGETVMFYTEKEGRFFGWISEHADRAGRKQYYYHLGREHDNRAVKGARLWWQPAPAVPFGATIK